MDKQKAHLVLVVFDVAAFFTCYYVYSQWLYVSNQLVNASRYIEIQKPLGFYCLMLLIPTIHVISLFRLKPSVSKGINYAFVILFVIMVYAGMRFDNQLEKIITVAGYVYCPDQSRSMRISEFRMYLRDALSCKK